MYLLLNSFQSFEVNYLLIEMIEFLFLFILERIKIFFNSLLSFFKYTLPFEVPLQ